mmetsp:Transcript_40599/g.71435  ORF Transcript_40599/g.71435 Transcript_40599/m.71435 type:complete len:335 (-) Transcript_40599:128-1132(-)
MGDDRLAETRAKVLTESLEMSNEPRWGYFGLPGPLCIGDDSYAPRLMRKPKDEDEGGEPICNVKTNPVKKGKDPSVYFSFAPPLCLDDPYIDGHQATKRGKVVMLDPEAAFRPPGKVRQKKMDYEYVPHMDGVKDPKEVRERYKDVMPPRQIYSGPAKKGGGGVYTTGVLFGFGEGQSFPEHVPDDYDAARKMRRAELEHHQAKLHACSEQPFKSMEYGNRHFQRNDETFHYDVPTHIPRDPRPDDFKNPHENAFKPPGPGKKGMLHGLLGEFPEHMEDPLPILQRKPPPAEGEEKQPFKIGFPLKVPKPTPSVTTLTRNMRAERPSSFARPLL